MQNRVILITGANRGIGKETTRGLARMGATICIACRNLLQAEAVCDEIKAESGNSHINVMHLDLASLASIRTFVEQFASAYNQLNVLINNAGSFSMQREETADGLERTIGTNYLGPFLLTHLLLPVIQTPGARIINVASDAAFYGKLDLDDLHMTRRYEGFRAYAASKQAIVLFTRELAERLRSDGITVNAVHPGHVATDIWPNNTWYLALISAIVKRFMISAEAGAQTSIYLATAEAVSNVTGAYFVKQKPREVPAICRDPRMQRALWQLSEQLTGVG